MSVESSDVSRTWVLLRGLGREAAHWDGFVERFQKAFPNDRVLTPDLPGTGVLVSEVSPISIPAMTESVRMQSHSSGKVYVLSISLGGMVALDWAQRYPNEVAGAILINSSVNSLSGLFQRIRPTALLKLVQGIREKDSLKREKILLGFICNQRAQDADLAARFAAITQKRPVKRSAIFRQLAGAAFFKPNLGPIRVPVLVLASLNDQMVNPNCSRAIAQQWGFPLKEHPSAGHDLPLDDPDWVLDQVRNWRTS